MTKIKEIIYEYFKPFFSMHWIVLVSFAHYCYKHQVSEIICFFSALAWISLTKIIEIWCEPKKPKKLWINAKHAFGMHRNCYMISELPKEGWLEVEVKNND